jgi:hypothetical protein
MRTTEARSRLNATVASGAVPADSPFSPSFSFLAQAKCRKTGGTAFSAATRHSTRQWLALEVIAVNSQLQAQYCLHPKFLLFP